MAVDALCEDYLDHCRATYRRPDGMPTREVQNTAISFRELRVLYGDIRADEFGIQQLKATRHKMIGAGFARRTVNDRVNRIVRMFTWAAEEVKVRLEVTGGLKMLKPLRRGQTEAPDGE